MFCQLYGGPKISKLGQVTWDTPTYGSLWGSDAGRIRPPYRYQIWGR